MNLMNNGALFLFAILLLSLILCSFLGGNCLKEGYNNYRPSSGYTDSDTIKLNSGVSYGHSSDYDSDSNSNSNSNTNNSSMDYDNYNHYDRSSFPTVFYGPHGATARLIISDGNQYISVVDGNGKTTNYNINKIIENPRSGNNKMSSFSHSMFTGPSGETAKIIIDQVGQYEIKIAKPDGSIRNYTAKNNYTFQGDDHNDVTRNMDNFMSYLNNKTFTSQYGDSARIYQGGSGRYKIEITKSNNSSYPMIFEILNGNAKLTINQDGTQLASVTDNNGRTTRSYYSFSGVNR